MNRLIYALILLATMSPAVQAQSFGGDDGLNWYKGNLHTHSLWSDGNDFPEMITRWYAERDYQFLAMTDHNVLSRGERWMPVEKIEARGGKTALGKYRDAMGEQWVETREVALAGEDGEADNKQLQVRLKGLAEYRGKFERPGEFLLMTGEEISDSVNGLPVHMNATNLRELIRPAGGKTIREAIAANMRSAIEQANEIGQPILVHLNHPNFGYAITAEDLAFVTDEKFFEVYNGHPGVNQLGDDKHASIEKIWDIANTIRIAKLKSPPLMGLGTDDSHYYHGRPGSQPGRGWITVRAKSLEPAELIAQINAGNFYASSGVVLEKVDFDSDQQRLAIQIKPVDGQTFETTFIGTPKDYDDTTEVQRDKDGKSMRATRIYSADVGKVLATVTGTSPEYQLTGDELYVRAVITSSADHPNPSLKGQKQQAWTQPVGWTLK